MPELTTAERDARAVELRERGLSYKEIARALGLPSPSAAWKLVNREKDRATSRAWKARNREKVQAYEDEYSESTRGACRECGRRMGRRNRDDGVCKSCRGNHAAEHLLRIGALWRSGLSLKEIAAEVGTSVSTVVTYINRLRDEGRVDEVPYRYDNRNFKGQHPRQLTPQARTEIADRYRAGASISAIAREFDCSHETVRRWVLKSGQTIRPANPSAKAA